MNELGILCFLSVADTHSFSNTARELRITQQAVSRCIQDLEKELGFTLFIRDQNLVIPTTAGEYLLNFFKQTENELQEIHPAALSPRNVMRIGISDWIGNSQWIRKSALRLRELFPEQPVLFYEVSAEKAREMVSRQLLDCHLTTNYELEHIQIPRCTIPVFSDSICLVHSSVRQAAFVHFCAGAGEADEMTVKSREMKLYSELGISPRPLKVYPDPVSVLLNVSIGNGVCFSPQCNRMSENRHFLYEPVQKQADIVIGVFQ